MIMAVVGAGAAGELPINSYNEIEQKIRKNALCMYIKQIQLQGLL